MAKPLQHPGRVRFAQFSPDGQRVITICPDNTAVVWDVEECRVVAEPIKHAGEILSARFSPNGKRIVTASRDQTARVWDTFTGLPLSEPCKHPGTVEYAEFSPDGQEIVTASQDGAAWIWEVPEASLPIPVWLPRLAEALAGQRLDDMRITYPTLEELFALKKEVVESSAPDPYTAWAKRLFAE